MSGKSFLLLLLLIAYPLESNADENPAPAENAKIQAAPPIPNAQADQDSTTGKQATGRELIEQSLELARLEAEIERKQALYAKGPKRKFISASTQAFEYRAYMADFVRKLEELGNADYPKALVKKNISAKVVVTVAIRRDGSVENVAINTSSNIPEVDEFVLSIVNKAQPFAPLPDTGQKIDVLHITRTWSFGPDDKTF